MWIAISSVVHSVPTTDKAEDLWGNCNSGEVTIGIKLLCFPYIGILYLIAILSFFWIDVIFGFLIVYLISELML